MGIERFFNSLIKNKSILGKEKILVLEKGISVDYFYIDFNSIIYKISQKVEDEINIILFNLIYGTEETKDLEKKWKFDGNTITDFAEHFTHEFVDETIFGLVEDDIVFISSQLVSGGELKKLYISMDSVPNMAKIIEQKKRRYNGYIVNSIKKNIYENRAARVGLARGPGAVGHDAGQHHPAQRRQCHSQAVHGRRKAWSMCGCARSPPPCCSSASISWA